MRSECALCNKEENGGNGKDTLFRVDTVLMRWTWSGLYCSSRCVFNKVA